MRLVALCVTHVDFAPAQLVVLTFYNAQRELLLGLLEEAALPVEVTACLDSS